MRQRLIAFGLILLLTALSGCGRKAEPVPDGTGDWEQVIDTGILRVAVTESATCVTGPSGVKSGYDVALIDLLCKELSLRCEYVDLTPGDEARLLHENLADCVWGVTYRPDLEETFDCSVPYLMDDQVIVYDGSTGGVYDTMEAALAVGTVAVTAGSPAQATAERLHLSAATCENEAEVFERILDGRAPLALVSYAATLAYLNDPAYASLAVGPVAESFEKVVMYRKDSYLNNRLRNALKKLNENGTIDRLADEYKLFGQVPGNHAASQYS